MADEWYYTEQGQQQGPVAAAHCANWLPPDACCPPTSSGKRACPTGSPPAPPAASSRQRRHRPLRRRPGTTRQGPVHVEPIDDDDDYGDQEPGDRRPRRQAKGLSTGAWVAIIGGGVGVLVLIACVILLIVLLGRSGTPTGPQVFTDTVAPGQKSFFVTFKAGQVAMFSIIGQGNADVEIYVFDRNNRLVTSSVFGFTDRRNVSWVPPQTETYRIELKNNGAFPNRVTITHN